MKRNLSLLLYLITLPAQLLAAPLTYDKDPATGRVIAMRNPLLQGTPQKAQAMTLRAIDPIAVAKEFLARNGSPMGITDPNTELEVLSVETDQIGMTHVRLSQILKGIPVYGGQLIVHLRSDLSVNSVNGNIVPVFDINVSPTIPEDEAIKVALKLWSERSEGEGTVFKKRLIVLNKGELDPRASGGDAYLSWEVQVVSTAGEEWLFFINAADGSTVYELDNTRRDIMRAVKHCAAGFCSLDRYDSYDHYIYGRSEGQPVRGPDPNYHLYDTDDLYLNLGYAHYYYLYSFGRDGANKLGGLGAGYGIFSSSSTVAYSYIGDGYADAFVNGVDCPNAVFSPYGYLMFCKGMVGTDIVGHEYAHGIAYYSVTNYGGPSGLKYSGQSGALSEAYADILAIALERYRLGTSDWILGTGAYTRNVANPGSVLDSGYLPYPGKFYSPGYYCGAGDNGGVHHNSTLFSHTAYIVANGGTFNGCNIVGLGADKEERLFYRALDSYTTPEMTYFSAGVSVLLACVDLFTAEECLEVVKAIKATELNQPGPCTGVTRVDPGCEADIDECPNHPNKIDAGVCGCEGTDIDTDKDGTMDCKDGCPADNGKTQTGICGCGVPEVDTDRDGSPDCVDICPIDGAKIQPGLAGCGKFEPADSDGDGALDSVDGCPQDGAKTQPGPCGCHRSDIDSHSDGSPDCNDTCPTDARKMLPGKCGCGVADADLNNNGVVDCVDLSIRSLTLSPPRVLPKKGSIIVEMLPRLGVTYVVTVTTSLGRGKSVSKKYRLKSQRGTIKKLKSGSIVAVTYHYEVPGTVVILSKESLFRKVKVK